jgi:hypothetical protein
LLAFGVNYKKNIKFFHSSNENLENLRKLFSNIVVFDNIRDFYTPNCILGRGGSA